MTLENPQTAADISTTLDDLLRKLEEKAERARINGAKSHGPITPEGKKRSSRNGIRHGMTANEHTVLEAESLEEYDEVRSAFIDQLHPATKAELRLVEKVANLDWRLERLAMMETSLLNMRADLSLDEIRERYTRMDGIGIVVLTWLEKNTPSGCSDLLRRYMGTLQNQFNAAYANFRTLKKDRILETTAGDTFSLPPYQEPVFDALLKSELVEPRAAYEDDVVVQCEEEQQQQQEDIEEPATAPAPAVKGPVLLPTEPTSQPKISDSPPIQLRPAA